MLFRPAGSVRPDTFNLPSYVGGGTVRPSRCPAGIFRLDTFNSPCPGGRVVSVPPWRLRGRRTVSACLVPGCPGPVGPGDRGTASPCSVPVCPGPVVPVRGPPGSAVDLAPLSGPFGDPVGDPAGPRVSGPGWSVRAISQHTPVGPMTPGRREHHLRFLLVIRDI